MSINKLQTQGIKTYQKLNCYADILNLRSPFLLFESMSVSSDFLGMSGLSQTPSQSFILNAGSIPYNPGFDVQTSEFLFTEVGLYNVNIIVNYSTAFPLNEIVKFSLYDPAHKQETEQVVGYIQGFGLNPGVTSFTINGLYLHKVNASRNLILHAQRLTGISPTVFVVDTTVTRIK